MTWRTIAASVTGTAHIRRELPCQDAYRVHEFGPSGEWLVVAVADGAGSAAHSDRGAIVACEGLVCRAALLDPAEVLTREGMSDLFTVVRAELDEHADRLSVPVRELACTALVAVVGPDAAAFAQVGDGAIVIDDGPDRKTVFWPEPAEYANETDFLTGDQYLDTLRFMTTDRPITQLAVFTDGLQRLVLDYSTRRPHAEFFNAMFGTLADAPDPAALGDHLRSFLDSPRVNDRTDDDKTLVLAVRQP